MRQLFVNNGYTSLFHVHIHSVAAGHKSDFITTYQNVQQTPLSGTLYKTMYVLYVNTYQRQGVFLVHQ